MESLLACQFSLPSLSLAIYWDLDRSEAIVYHVVATRRRCPGKNLLQMIQKSIIHHECVLVAKLGPGKLAKLDSKENRKGLFLYKNEPLSYITEGETGNFSSAAVD